MLPDGCRVTHEIGFEPLTSFLPLPSDTRLVLGAPKVIVTCLQVAAFAQVITAVTQHIELQSQRVVAGMSLHSSSMVTSPTSGS